MPKMKSNFRGLVTLLAKNLYPEPDVFVRELIQNAHDSIQLRRARTPECPAESSGKISITVEPADRCIRFSDDGLGMNRYVIEEFLSTIGSSGTSNMTAELRRGAQCDVATIGQFGIGLLSALVVAERVDVYTRHLETGEAWHWVNTGDDEYTLDPTSEMPHTGTQVIVTVKPEYHEFLREQTIEAGIRKYADLLPVPILLNGRGPVNAVLPPWEVAETLPLAEREDYLTSFLRARYPDLPLLIIPVNLPQLQARGVLYITDQHIPGINTSGFVDLYQNRMCLRAQDTELLPDWARFVRGMVDSRRLQPTAARDNVHRDEEYYALRRALGDVIIGTIIQTARERPEYFSRLCRWHHFHFKGLCVADDQFFDRLALHLPFDTSEGEMTLEAYRQRQAASPGAPTPIYYFPNEADAARFYEVCRLRRILALNAGKCFEELLLQKLVERQPGHWVLRRLDHLASEEIYQRLPRAQEEAFQPLLAAVSRALIEQQLSWLRVGVRHFEPPHVCSVLLDVEQEEPLDRLRRLFAHPLLGKGLEGLRGDVSEAMEHPQQELLLNTANPTVQRLARLETWGDDASGLALKGLYLAALLHSKGRLTAENSSAIYAQLLQSLDLGLSLQSAWCESRQQVEALRRVVENQQGSLPRSVWIDAVKALYGKSPAEFRERIANASDEDVARLLDELLTLDRSNRTRTILPSSHGC